YSVFSARHWQLQWDAASLALLVATFWAVLVCLWRVMAEVRGRIGRPGAVGEAAGYLPLLVLALYPVQIATDLPGGGLLTAGGRVAGLAPAELPLLSGMRARMRGGELASLLDFLRPLWPFAAGVVVAGAFVVELKAHAMAGTAAGGGRTFREVTL